MDQVNKFKFYDDFIDRQKLLWVRNNDFSCVDLELRISGSGRL